MDGRLTRKLSIWMKDLNVHRTMCGSFLYNRQVQARKLVSFVYLLAFPVCPEQVILKDRHGKDVAQVRRLAKPVVKNVSPML